MSITLNLSPDQQAALERRAAAMGTDIPTYVLYLLEQRLDSQSDTVPKGMTHPQKKAKFDAWMATHAFYD